MHIKWLPNLMCRLFFLVHLSHSKTDHTQKYTQLGMYLTATYKHWNHGMYGKSASKA